MGTPRKKLGVPQKTTAQGRKPRVKLSPESWAALRIRYESDPDATPMILAEEFGVAATTISGKVFKEGWRKSEPDLKGMSKAALEEYKKRRALLKDPTEDELNQLADEITAEFAAAARAELMEKHQKEWNAPRQLAYEAIQTRNFDLAKLAKITSETLTNTQNGERKAWGLDKGVGNETNIRVVIERG